MYLAKYLDQIQYVVIDHPGELTRKLLVQMWNKDVMDDFARLFELWLSNLHLYRD